jgi:hypothetical protein
MYITAFSILKNHHESEDIVQDAILRVSKNLHKEYILITAKELNGTKYMIFSNTTGGEIRFIQGKISAQLQIDSEKGDVIEIDIQGHRGILVEKDNFAILSWTNNDKSFVIHGNVEKSILLLIVESLKKSN